MWHFLAFVVWGGLSKVTYIESKCEDNNEDGGQDPGWVCGKEGAALGLFTLLWIFVCAVGFNIVYLIGRRKHVEEINRLPDFKANQEYLLGLGEESKN